MIIITIKILVSVRCGILKMSKMNHLTMHFIFDYKNFDRIFHIITLGTKIFRKH
jgi:hypothetical protein